MTLAPTLSHAGPTSPHPTTLLTPTQRRKAFLDYLADITIGALHNWTPAHWVPMNIHEADAELFPSITVSRRSRCGGRHVLCMPTIKRRFWKLTKVANLPRFITDEKLVWEILLKIDLANCFQTLEIMELST